MINNTNNNNIESMQIMDNKAIVEAYKDTRKLFRQSKVNSVEENTLSTKLTKLYVEICKRHINILQY